MFLIYIFAALVLIFIFYKYKFSSADNKKPEKTKGVGYTIEDRYNELRNAQQKEMDDLLEKINKYGYRSLSIKEQERLKKLSGK